jgi:type I restriction enzyme, S subunit
VSEHWEEVTIADLGKIVTGRTPPSSNPEFFGDCYPFITPTDMSGQKHMGDTERYISKAGFKLLNRCVIPARSVIVSCIGWQMGKAGITTREAVTNQQINTVIPNDRVDPDFLFYHFCTRRDELKRLGSIGTRTPIVNKSVFGALKLKIPPLFIQRRIAHILSAYDDLIENNLRRIRILEEMARSLYREWFVHFRFPGHEHARHVDSSVGPIPDGWEVATIGDVCKCVTDGSHLSPKSVDHGLPMASSKDMHDLGLNFETCRKISPEDFEKLVRSGCRPEKNDVLVTKDGANYLKHIFVVRDDLEVVLLSSIATIQLQWSNVIQGFAELCWNLNDQIKNLLWTRDLLLVELFSALV